jgi:uncharacterized protein (TIRG00374 family)
MRRRLLRSTVTWGGLIVSAAFAYFAVRHVRLSEVWNGLRESNYWWLLPALALLAVAIYLKALRWRYLFAAETRPAIGPVFAAMLLGYFFNNILPARAGEAARIIDLNRRAGTSRAEATATIVLERAYDTFVLLVLLFVTLPWLPHITWLHSAVVLAVVLSGVLLLLGIILGVFGVRPLQLALKPLGRLPFISRDGLENVAHNLARGLAALRQPRLVLAALFWSTLAWLALAVSTWFVLRGFHLGLSVEAGLLIVIATNLAQILPSSPGAIGVFEAATLVSLRAYGVSDSRALSCALVIHAVNVLPFIPAGLPLLRGSLGFRQARAEEASLLPADRSVGAGRRA